MVPNTQKILYRSCVTGLYNETHSLGLLLYLCQKWRKVICDMLLCGVLGLREDGNLMNSLSLLKVSCIVCTSGGKESLFSALFLVLLCKGK